MSSYKTQTSLIFSSTLFNCAETFTSNYHLLKHTHEIHHDEISSCDTCQTCFITTNTVAWHHRHCQHSMSVCAFNCAETFICTIYITNRQEHAVYYDLQDFTQHKSLTIFREHTVLTHLHQSIILLNMLVKYIMM